MQLLYMARRSHNQVVGEAVSLPVMRIKLKKRILEKKRKEMDTSEDSFHYCCALADVCSIVYDPAFVNMTSVL